jgi:hypothetical protein
MIRAMRCPIRWLAALAALSLAACDLRFDAQTIELVADPAQDRLDVLLVYHGLSYAKKIAPDKQPAKLEGFLAEQPVMLLESWPFLFPLARHDEDTAAFFEHARMEAGPLHLDGDGRLSLFQMVRISRVSELLAKANAEIGAAIAAQLEAEGELLGLAVNDATRKATQQAIAGKHAWLAVRGAALELAVPCDVEFHGRMRSALLRQILGDAVREGLEDGVPPERREARILGSAWVAFLIESAWSILRESGSTVFRVGLAGAERTRIIKPAQGEYDRTLLDALVARDGKRPPQVTEEEIAERFKVFRARD